MTCLLKAVNDIMISKSISHQKFVYKKSENTKMYEHKLRIKG